jgi:hypothetical protein
LFNFKRLSSAQKPEAPASLGELFSQLDRKATHTSLRPIQVSALEALDKQASERDVVIKLSTGSGKTLVGLVYAEMMRRRYRGDPVVYLCPTNQLVEQVFRSGSAIGVPICTFPEKGLPYDAFSGDCVLVCTFDRMFNAKTVFESNSIRPCCIVLDDVHAGVERVKNCYTAKIPDTCFEKFRAILRPLCEKTDPATWRYIEAGSADFKYEIPYWIWSNIHQEIANLLENHLEDKELLFRWENISRYLDLARVCISGQTAEISLPIAAVEEISAYSSAKHRLFMSASIKDGSALISDLNCAPSAFNRIIEPSEDEGAGERMMLVASLLDSNSEKSKIAEVCKKIAATTNVVVLTSSIAQATDWTQNGATLHQGKEVENAIEILKTSTGNYFVFAQRFDGVDLPDEACRILIIDGVPSGDRLCEKIDYQRQKDSPENDVRIVNRFEQAIGRAVRSSADFAAIILVGSDIASFIGRRSVRDILEPRTKAQIDLGKELATLTSDQTISDIIPTMAQALLERNEDWKDAHRTKVKEVIKTPRSSGALTINESLAIALRDSWIKSKARNFQDAISTLKDVINNYDYHPLQKAEILYRMASYQNEIDVSAAAETYRAVFSINSNFPRPEQIIGRKFKRIHEQALNVREYFQKFSEANAAIARIDEIASKLSYAMPYKTFEQGILELGEIIGADSSRPENDTGRGPDNLWILDDAVFCIECKNEKTSSIHKDDAAQLSLSISWCNEMVDLPEGRITPIFATNITAIDRAEDASFGARVLTEKHVFQLIESLRKVVLGLSFDGSLFNDSASIARALAANDLTGKQIASKLTTIQ